MTEPDIKVLTVKMRGCHGCAKTEFLLALARLARALGMTPALEADGHNMSITSTRRSGWRSTHSITSIARRRSTGRQAGADRCSRTGTWHNG